MTPTHQYAIVLKDSYAVQSPFFDTESEAIKWIQKTDVEGWEHGIYTTHRFTQEQVNQIDKPSEV